MANQDVAVSISAGLSANVDVQNLVNASVSMLGALDSNVEVQNLVNVGPISMAGSLSASVSYLTAINVAISMRGALTANFKSEVAASDLVINFESTMIYSRGCMMADLECNLRRYRGDTYPVRATLAVHGNYNLAGTTVQMSTKIGTGMKYTFDGEIIDEKAGIVEFAIPAAAVEKAGVGTYDIQGDTGSYIYTYQAGVFTLLDDLTV